MGIFDRFPYSSTHEMNLDFMLGKATEIAEDMQTVATGMAQVQAGLSAISEKTEQATQAAAQAAASASSIEGSVTAAEEAAEEAQMHNESAQTWANNAMTYKADCQRSATEAAASSSSAAQAATAAAGSEDTVAQYAQAANASAQSAANNNDSAHQYANQASASASNATFHSSNAQTAATNAQTAATNANTSATNANTSATNASASADRAASLKTDVETLHRMCTAAVDQAATEAVNAANSAAQAAATKTDVENLVESLPEDFTDLNNTVNQLSDEIDGIDSDVDKFTQPAAFEDGYYTGSLKPYVFPDSDFEMFGINLLTDGRNFYHDFDITSKKNAGSTTYYFSPNGSNSNNGTTKDAPRKSVDNTFRTALNDGDTLVLLDGVYAGFWETGNACVKAINIVAENNGKVIIVNSTHNYTYTLTEGKTYETSESDTVGVLFKYNDAFIQLAKKTTLADVKTTPYSYAVVDTKTYVNINGTTPTNENVYINKSGMNSGGFMLQFLAYYKNTDFYVEGITFIGGSTATVIVDNSASYYANFYAKDCKFYGSANTGHDAVEVHGSDAYFVNCECAYTRKDGFNYQRMNSRNANGIEIDCKGYCCGKNGASATNCNGSTQHRGIIVRINGIYHDNYGPNIADTTDTSGETKSLNIRCTAFDSNSSTGAERSDFMIHNYDAEMWCESCVSDFGISDYNFACIKGAGSTDEVYPIMHLNRCKIGTKYETGAGEYEITNN